MKKAIPVFGGKTAPKRSPESHQNRRSEQDAMSTTRGFEVEGGESQYFDSGLLLT